MARVWGDLLLKQLMVLSVCRGLTSNWILGVGVGVLCLVLFDDGFSKRSGVSCTDAEARQRQSESRMTIQGSYLHTWRAGVCDSVCVARGPGMLEEIIHNLDYCDILVLGEELRPEQESLQLQRSALLGKHLDATNSTSGMSIYGTSLW